MNERVERVLLQIGDDDLPNIRLEIVNDIPEQVVRHRPRGRHILDLERDRIRLEDAHPDRQHALTFLVAQDNDGHVGDGIDQQALD